MLKPLPLISFILALLAWSLPVAAQGVGERVESQPTGAATASSDDLAAMEAQMISTTNDFRREQNTDTLQVQPQLTATARYFANFMAETGKYGHKADDRSPTERANAHEYDSCIVLENIAYYRSPEKISPVELAGIFVDGWKKSAGHRKNMLDAEVGETGVAMAQASDGTYYAVQMFGRPASETIVFQVTNRTLAEIRYTLFVDVEKEEFGLPPRHTRVHYYCRRPRLEIAPQKPLAVQAGREYVVTGKAETGYQLQIEAELHPGSSPSSDAPTKR